ncbi:hypothetical protein pkur_cds_325 [Pandoravirus kuranda]|uniref:Uncharacterized protein n=1 Tax=Pandoravirus kuranda TaxID=3019033 RepID=A0AA95EEJ5_9VIRU|nr:hypothetical protein pkur_cds_325 [Pandoravirus kuranda]
MQGKKKGSAAGGATMPQANGRRRNASGRSHGVRLHSGAPRTYLVPIRKRVASPAAVLASLGICDGSGARSDHRTEQENERCDAVECDTTVVTFVRLTKAQMARGRQRAWEERCARRRERSRQPVPASQICGECGAVVHGAVDACPPCGAALVHVVAAVAVADS